MFQNDKVINKIAVIAKDRDAFFSFMKPFQISMFSKAKDKFWINKGATEYFLVTSEKPGAVFSDVIMLGGCTNQLNLYVALQACIGATATTNAEADRDAELSEVINLGTTETNFGDT